MIVQAIFVNNVPNAPQTKIQTMTYKTKQCGLYLLFQLSTPHFPYGSSHTDGFSFSHIPSSQPCTCFLCLESTKPRLFTWLDPCHCSGLKHHLLREVSPNKSWACTSLHLVSFLDSLYHTALYALLHGCSPRGWLNAWYISAPGSFTIEAAHENR